MWIEELKNGKFRAVERYENPFTGKQRKVSIVIEKNTAKNRKLAQEALADKIAKATSSAPIETGQVTLEKLIDAYLADQHENVRLSTCRRNQVVCNSFIKLFGADVLVNRLTARLVKDVFTNSGKSNTTLNEYLTRFKALIRWGYRNDFLDDIRFLDKIERFPEQSGKEKVQHKFLEASEVSTLLAGMAIEEWRDLTEFLVLTGLRIGEAIALKIEDVDMKERLIHVRSSADIVDQTREDGPTKTRTSERSIFVQDELLPLCKKLRFRAMTGRLVTGCSYFIQNKQEKINYYAYAKYLKENAARILDKPIPVTPHMLRHTHVSLLAEQGLTIDEISRRVGHDGSKVTREIYLHITDKLREKDNQRIKNIKFL